jgi:flagellin-like protein
MGNKKGLAPVVATIILIALVMVIVVAWLLLLLYGLLSTIL